MIFFRIVTGDGSGLNLYFPIFTKCKQYYVLNQQVTSVCSLFYLSNYGSNRDTVNLFLCKAHFVYVFNGFMPIHKNPFFFFCHSNNA